MKLCKPTGVRVLTAFVTSIVFAAVAVAAPFCAAQGGDRLPYDVELWRDDFEKAARQAVVAGKPLCLYFYRPGISLCEQFIRVFQASPEAGKGIEGWVPIAINEWNLSNKELAEKYHIEIVPQVILLSAKGLEIARYKENIDLPALIGALNRYGRPDIPVHRDSPVGEGDLELGSLRLVFHRASDIDHARARVAPIGGQEVHNFVLGDPADEARAGALLKGWGEPETRDDIPCRNTDQTGPGDGRGGFAYVGLPVERTDGSYRVVFSVWGDSAPFQKVQIKTGPARDDWIVFRFKQTRLLKAGKFTERAVDFPNENLPIVDGKLVIGMGEGDQQIWVSRIVVYHFVDERPPEL